MSLCFLEAFQDKVRGKITEDEYLDYLLAHCQGWTSIEHEEDDMMPWDPQKESLRDSDPFGYQIWLWSRQTHLDNTKGIIHSVSFYHDLRTVDVKPFKDVFKAYQEDGVDGIQEKLALLKDEDARNIVLALAIHALQDVRKDVLEFCLNRGFNWSEFFLDSANDFEKKKKDADICKVLQQSEFRRMWPWPIKRKARNPDEEEDPAEIFDYGGEYEIPW
jgi:hypothetical protein